MDGKKRNIPIYATLKDFSSQSKEKAKYCIIGVATKGGVLPEEMRTMLHEAIEMVDTNDVEDQHVIDELQRGYKLKDRLVRPAMVRVARNTK